MKLDNYLGSDKPEIRFWGASGWATLAVGAPQQKPSPALLKAVQDSDLFVAAEAAHALCYLESGEKGAVALVKAFASGSKGAYSALETLALTPVGKGLLQPHKAELQVLTRAEKAAAPVPAEEENAVEANGGEGNEEGAAPWQARAILVNLGELPVSRLYGVGAQRKGLTVNSNRKPLTPGPKGNGGAGAGAARKQRKALRDPAKAT